MSMQPNSTTRDSLHSESCREAMNECEADNHVMDDWPAISSMNDSIAMICHEIRNPIAALQNGIELIGSTTLDSDGLVQVSEMMRRQLGQVTCLLDDLSNGDCLTSGKLQVKREPVDLAQICLHALDTIRRLIDDKEHELTVTLPPAGTVWVRGDRNRLIGVIVNLLANAAKYTDTGGRMKLMLTADSGKATLTIRDSGIGISKEFQPRIFDLYTQAPRVPDNADHGLGLGLPLVRNIVRLHEGEVSVYSAGEGLGSEFTVRLPRLLKSKGSNGANGNGHSLPKS